MGIATVMFLSLLAAEPAWELATESDGIKIYSRARDGEDVKEMKAVGVVDASPQEVWKAIRDYPHYTKTMPYTQEAKVLAEEEGGKKIWLYSRLDLPLVDQRDYVIKLSDDSDWKDGAGFLKVSWTGWNEADRNVPEKKGVVRVKVNDGYWLLEPRDDGKKTYATYFVHTDPGGSIPKWIANRANSTAVPNVFTSIKKAVDEGRKAEKK